MWNIYPILFIVFIIICNYEYVNGYTWPSNRYAENSINDANTPSISDHEIQYKYKTVQTGSALIPYRGATVHVSPDHNQTRAFITKIDTTIINPRKRKFGNNNNNNGGRGGKLLNRNNNHHHHHQQLQQNRNYHERQLQRKSSTPCVKCPVEQILIAQKRLDGVLIEPPAALSCSTNQPFSKSLFEIETLFGPKFMFILPQGSHTFIGKIKNKRNSMVSASSSSSDIEEFKTCLLKYKVVVRQCPKYRTKNRQLKVKCDLGNIWGSKCTFVCRNKGAQLNHRNPIICNDDLEWIGVEPMCQYTRHDNDITTGTHNHHVHRNNDGRDDDGNEIEKLIKNTSLVSASRPSPSSSSSACELPVPPENGKFLCEINDINKNNNQLSTPSGSICRVNCASNYEIPNYLQFYTNFYCEHGQWNSTMFDFCQKK